MSSACGSPGFDPRRGRFFCAPMMDALHCRGAQGSVSQRRAHCSIVPHARTLRSTLLPSMSDVSRLTLTRFEAWYCRKERTPGEIARTQPCLISGTIVTHEGTMRATLAVCVSDMNPYLDTYAPRPSRASPALPLSLPEMARWLT